MVEQVPAAVMAILVILHLSATRFSWMATPIALEKQLICKRQVYPAQPTNGQAQMAFQLLESQFPSQIPKLLKADNT